MTEDNSRQPGEPSISSSPQSHGMYPPPQSYSPTRSAFVDIRIGDYTRDGTAAALLFVSLFLPWSATVGIARVGSSALVLLLVLPTLLSLASLLLPYVARLGMLGPNWNVGQIRVLRLVANGPLIATVVGLVVYDVIRGMFRFSESSSVFTGNGVGAGAWFGLAGALLAAQPRAAEIRIDPRTAPRWLALVKPLVFVAWGSSVASALLALIYILVSVSRYRYYDGPQTFESLIVLFVSSAVPIVVVGVAAVGLARRFASWRLTIAALGIALLAAGLLHSISEGTSVELFHTVTASPYYGITFLIAAAAITFIPFGVASVGDGTHPGYVWLAAARNGMLLIAVWSFGVGFSQIAMAATQFGIVPWGDALVLAVLAILFGILAVVGVRSLSLRYSSLDPRPSREVGLGVCVGLLVLMLARLVVQSAMYGEIYYSAWIFDLAMVVLVVLVALALTVSPAVRNLYAGVQLFASATTVTAAIPNLGQPVRPSGRALEAADPRTPAAVLFEIASSSPELRPAIAANPSTYDDLVTWLEALGDPAVDVALDRRAAGQFGLPEPEPEPGRVPVPVPAPVPVQSSRRALEAADPRTPAAVLFEIASSSPELRPAIAANPSTYDDLVTWLEALGDPAVDAALDRRAAGQFGLLGPEPEPATETFISSGTGVQLQRRNCATVRTAIGRAAICRAATGPGVWADRRSTPAWWVSAGRSRDTSCRAVHRFCHSRSCVGRRRNDLHRDARKRIRLRFLPDKFGCDWPADRDRFDRVLRMGRVGIRGNPGQTRPRNRRSLGRRCASGPGAVLQTECIRDPHVPRIGCFRRWPCSVVVTSSSAC